MNSLKKESNRGWLDVLGVRRYYRAGSSICAYRGSTMERVDRLRRGFFSSQLSRLGWRISLTLFCLALAILLVALLAAKIDSIDLSSLLLGVARNFHQSIHQHSDLVVRILFPRLCPLGIQVDSYQLSGFLWPAEGAAPPASVFLIHKCKRSRLRLWSVPPACIWLRGKKVSRSLKKFVRFTNSDSFPPTENRIRGQTMQLWSQSRPDVPRRIN
jgi:hypothetical protein